MSTKAYDKAFPRYTRYKQDRPIPHWNAVARSGAEVPLYYLGWMVRARGITRYIGGYYGIDKYLVRPNWYKHGCKPSKQEDLDRLGLMMPDAHLFGDNHVFLRIASNDRDGIEYLHTEDGIKTVVRQAILGLGLKEGSFDTFLNLMWVRWPEGRTFPELKDNFPCISEYHFRYAVSEANENQESPKDNDDKKHNLPEAPPEVVSVIKRNFYRNARSNSN